jgi:hypothetical protein
LADERSEIMDELRDALAEVVGQACPVKRVCHLIQDLEVNSENIAEIDDAIKQLESHESDIRRLRQLLTQQCMKYWVSDWIQKNKLDLNKQKTVISKE